MASTITASYIKHGKNWRLLTRPLNAPRIVETPHTRGDRGGPPRVRKGGKSAASVGQVRCPLARFYQWQQNVHGYRGPNPAAELKIFVGKQLSKRGRERDLQWFRQGEPGSPWRLGLAMVAGGSFTQRRGNYLILG